MNRALTKTSMLPRTSGLLAGCLAAVALLATASAASAKTFHPTRTDDPAPNGCKKKDCSLREAVIASNARSDAFGSAGSAIVLRPGKRYVLTRRGPGEDAAATGDLDLTNGATAVHTKKGRGGVKPAVIDGNDIDRIFDGVRGLMTLERVVLRDGHARIGPGDDGDGGAIGGEPVLTLRKSRLVSNVAEGDGGAIYSAYSLIVIRWTLLKGNAAAGDGGAVSGPLLIRDSRATHNSAGGAGGMASLRGIRSAFERTHLSGNRAAGAGGAIFSRPTDEVQVSVAQSTVADNESGAYGGGLAINGAVSYSTISGNRAASSGGGIGISSGGGIGRDLAGVRLENSTIADNRAGGDGGGIGAFGGNSSPFGGNSTTRLNGVTVARNLADSDSAGGGLGGGLYLGGGLGGLDVISVQNTVVALNAVGAGASGRDCYNASTGFDSLGYNLIGDVTGCTGFGAAGDLFGGALKLGKLADNGGQTKTIALKRGSTAIDHAGSDAPPKDQRGFKRSKKPDIGAYERVVKK